MTRLAQPCPALLTLRKEKNKPKDTAEAAPIEQVNPQTGEITEAIQVADDGQDILPPIGSEPPADGGYQ